MRTIAALAAPVPAPEKALGHGARVAWYCSNKSNFNAWRFFVTMHFGPSSCWGNMAGEANFIFRECNSEARAENHWIAGAGWCKALKAEVTACGHLRA